MEVREVKSTFDAQVKVGRLLEVWATKVVTLADTLSFQRRYSSTLVAGRRFIACADYRELQVVAPEVWRAWVTGMKSTNPQLERSALILPRDSHALRNQVERALAEAGHRDRRICLDAAEAKAWLSGSLDDAERSRLSTFLRERHVP